MYEKILHYVCRVIIPVVFMYLHDELQAVEPSSYSGFWELSGTLLQPSGSFEDENNGYRLS